MMSRGNRLTQLHTLLEAYSPVSNKEQEYLLRMKQLLDSPADPFSRSHFRPGHFTSSSFILSPNQKSLLLILHSKLHRWLQPGGHIEPTDSTCIESAKREMKEEVGIIVDTSNEVENPLFDIDIHTIPARNLVPEHLHFDLRFVFTAPDLQFSVGSDALQAKWVLLHEITATRSDHSVVRAVKKLL